MSQQQTITVEGDTTLRLTLAAAEHDLENLDQSDSARLVESRAQAAAPKRSGTLAHSVRAKDLGHGAAAVASELVYAPVIHYGWHARNISPQPFLVTALANSTQLVEINSQRQANQILSHVRGA